MDRDNKGKFKKGHGGLKPKGAVSERTKAWDALKEMFIGDYTDNVKDYLQNLYEENPDKFFAAYCQLLEYFKPKYSRTDITSKGESLKPDVIIRVDNEKTAKQLSELE